MAERCKAAGLGGGGPSVCAAGDGYMAGLALGCAPWPILLGSLLCSGRTGGASGSPVAGRALAAACPVMGGTFSLDRGPTIDRRWYVDRPAGRLRSSRRLCDRPSMALDVEKQGPPFLGTQPTRPSPHSYDPPPPGTVHLGSSADGRGLCDHCPSCGWIHAQYAGHRHLSALVVAGTLPHSHESLLLASALAATPWDEVYSAPDPLSSLTSEKVVEVRAPSNAGQSTQKVYQAAPHASAA